MDKRQVIVRVDDRVRLLSAVLSATNYPDKSQERKKHGTHLHARGTRKVVSEHSHHPAVHAMQVLLDQNVPLSSIFNYGLRLTWPALTSDDMPRWVPPRWNEQLKHFYELTNLAKWWQDEDDNWQTPMRQLNEIFSKVDLYTFLEPFVGKAVESFIFMPNISYPTDQNVSFRLGGELIAIVPPPLAWGDSPPWPFKDDEALAYRAAVGEFSRILMGAFMRDHEDVFSTMAEKALPVDEAFIAKYPTWQDQFLGLFTSAAVYLFLEESVSSLEAKSYLQHMQKVEGVALLPSVTSVFHRYLDEYKANHYSNFAEFLPAFPKQLKVAKTISAL
jgi:hypothetical protein